MSILDKIKDLFGVSNNPETVVKKVTARVKKEEKKITSTPKKVYTPKKAKTKAKSLIKKAKKK